MEQNVKQAYEDYVARGVLIKEKTVQRKNAQRIIENYHTASGLKIITEDGFKSQIIDKETTALDKDKLIAKFGEEALADCYTTKQSTSFRCDRMLLG